MQLQIVVDLPGISISQDAQNQWLYVDWKGSHDQESARTGCLLILKSLRAWPCHKLLNDNSNITAVNAQLTSWGIQWLKDVEEAGVQYVAWIAPRSLATWKVIKTAAQGINNPIIGTFDDLATAHLWLQQQPT